MITNVSGCNEEARNHWSVMFSNDELLSQSLSLVRHPCRVMVEAREGKVRKEVNFVLLTICNLDFLTTGV